MVWTASASSTAHMMVLRASLWRRKALPSRLYHLSLGLRLSLGLWLGLMRCVLVKGHSIRHHTIMLLLLLLLLLVLRWVEM